MPSFQTTGPAWAAGSVPVGRPPLAQELAERIAKLPPPVIVFNKSHSGSRLVAELLRGQGLFIGSVLNESLDALPFLPLVERVVLDHYPDFRCLWREAEWPSEIQRRLADALNAHLADYPPGTPWGWKLCETVFILPLLAAIFPRGRFIHLIRDGRDVAFSDHVAPELPFWRKVYFETEAVQSWRGMRLDHAAYQRRSHLYNAQHWQESVRLGRAFGAMLGPSYYEIRYEQLCTDPMVEGRALLDWLGFPTDEGALATLSKRVLCSAIGKHRGRPPAEQRAVQALIEPTLLACGYECTPLPPRPVENFRAFTRRLQLGVRRRLSHVPLA